MKLRKAPQWTSNEGLMGMVRGRVTGRGEESTVPPHPRRASAVWTLFVPRGSDVRDSLPRVKMVETGDLKMCGLRGSHWRGLLSKGLDLGPGLNALHRSGLDPCHYDIKQTEIPQNL